MLFSHLARLTIATGTLLVAACSSTDQAPTGGDVEAGAAGTAGVAGGPSTGGKGGNAMTSAGASAGGSSGGSATSSTSGASSGGASNAGNGSGGASGSVGSGGGGGTGAKNGSAGGTGGRSGSAGSGGGGTGGAAGTAGSGGLTDVCPSGSLLAKCTNTNAKEIACHFGGAPGNYQVSVELGGKSAGDMYVEAESYRRMLGQTKTMSGQTKGYRFVVNVRQPEGQPIQNGANDGMAGLDVYVRGTAPVLSAICYEPIQAPAMIWIGGDSTVCDQSGTDYSGWGQHLPQFFDVPVSIANYADSGESSASFLNGSSLFGAIKARWHAGDWFFVQLGHNDKDTPAATFQANMMSFVTQAKAAGVHIVLVTPISRVGYSLAAEHVNSTGANLPQIIRDIGKSQNVPVIDLTVTTWNWLQTITWQNYFALGTDKTHTNPNGADVIAGFVRDAIKTQGIASSSYLR